MRVEKDFIWLTVSGRCEQDYIFSLLTGYTDPPAGFEIRDGMNYNRYFPGNAISMARVLFDGVVEYPDGA